jgi:hypothetical protein
MIFREGELEFDFSDAIDGFKFDDTDKESDYYHGLSHCMKAVDFIVELETDYLFVEVKDFHAPEEYADRERFKHLKNVLITKFRDTFLYRFAENKIDKPVRYLCLLTLDNALTSRLMKEIKRAVPEGMASKRWQKPIAAGCVVLNMDRWNSRFPQWKLRRI